MVKTNTPIALIILDGWGINEHHKGNAVYNARTSNLDSLFRDYPASQLKASGMDVGLPDGQMGNSEVGHLNIGAGRIVYQDYTRINRDIEDGSFFKNKVLVEAVERAKASKTSLHVMGLLSDGGVHSHINHLFALLELAKRRELNNVLIHVFLDGRDVPPKVAQKHIKQLQRKIEETGIGKIATVMGRYYAMDRDKRWDRTQKAYEAIVMGKGIKAFTPEEAVDKAYERGETDEFVKPTVLMTQDNKPITEVAHGDSIIFFNFRPDRARQLTRAFVDVNFKGFERKVNPKTFFVCMTLYDEDIENVQVAYKPVKLEDIFGEVISRHGFEQLRLAETEKYAHVTFFFNGGNEKAFPGEERILIPSPKVATYDQKPEMSAYEVTERAVKEIQKNKYHCFIINYANPDMVGHTGDFEAAVKAVEAVDECVGKVVNSLLKQDAVVLITSDHGNCEQMIDYETGEPHTAHTTNPVPFLLINSKFKKVRDGRLCDIAPTMLHLMGIEKPDSMTGESLIIK